MATVAVNALAARQWEQFLSRQHWQSGRNVWRRERVYSYGHWIDECWQSGAETPGGALSDAQTRALWLTVIRNSRQASGLIEHRTAARWADAAWNILVSMGIRPWQEDRRFVESDFSAFQEWAAEFRTQLNARSWIEPAARERDVAQGRLPEDLQQLQWLEMPERTTTQRALVSMLRERGIESSDVAIATNERHAKRVRAAHRAEELERVADWAVSHMRASGSARIAVAVPGDYPDRRLLHNMLGEALDGGAAQGQAFVDTQGTSLAGMPAVGAAMTAIELLCPDATIFALSRWLRSPFFGHNRLGDRADAARVEARLRSRLDCQRGFRAAWQYGGLSQALEKEAPAATQALQSALQVLADGPALKTPTAWARTWQDALTAMGWPGSAVTAEDSEPAVLLERALDALARLSPLLGKISAAQALEELGGIVARPGPAVLPLHGVFIFDRIDDIGPGFDGIWATGFSSGEWPRPPNLNPLIPHALRVELGLAGATPARVLADAHRSLRRLAGLAPEIVVSWPESDDEGALSPTPMIDSFAIADEAEFASRSHRSEAAVPIEWIDDRAPPLPGGRIPGGAGALDQQSRCPVRAFCQYRLQARELDPFVRGVSPAVRGSIVHRAAELMFANALGDQLSVPEREHIVSAATSATSRFFGRARRMLGPLFDLERERTVRLLEALLRLDGQRSAFSILDLERDVSIAIANAIVDVRIDRLDRLADGSPVLIDYKTGSAPTGRKWFDERLAQLQLPLYACGLDDVPAAIVECRLRPDEESYRGVWLDADTFPGRSIKLPDGRTWPEQLQVWRKQIEDLASEFLAGDVRVFSDGAELAEGSYAPLTRIYETLAIASRAEETPS